MDAAARAADTCEAMSLDDAAQVRRAYEVWNESGPRAVVEQFYADDAVYREGPGWPGSGVYTGRAAVLERMESLVELVGPIEVALDDLLDLGDGRFVACVRNVVQGPTSATPYTDTFAVVHRVRDGLIVEADYYLDRNAALDAVGLEE
jgi:ketosteroid isomerase-like protein